jgi:hypothetical protein
MRISWLRMVKKWRIGRGGEAVGGVEG